MKIKLEKVLFIIVCLIVLSGILSCEKNIHHNFYMLSQCTSILLSIFFLLLFLKLNDDKRQVLKSNIVKNYYIIAMFFCMIITSIVNSVYNASLKGLVYTVMFMLIMIILTFGVPTFFSIYKKYIHKFLLYISFFSFFLSVIGIYIYYFGDLLGYNLIYRRASSIFFDPNFFATFIAIGIISSFNTKNGIFKIIIPFINIYAIILSGSRGALLSLGLVMAAFVIIKKMSIKKILLIILVIIALMFGLKYLNNIGFFRSYQGTNGRLEMIQYLINPIKERPIWGYGYDVTSSLLEENNFTNSSSHNSLVDFTIGYGIPCSLLFVFVLVMSLIKGIKQQRYVIFLINLLLIINSNTILYNIGGVSMCSMLWTIFLGMNIVEMKNEEIKD